MNLKTRYLLLALLIAGVTFCYVQFNPVAEPVHLRVLGGIGLLQLAVSLRGWKRLTGSVFVPYTVFLGAAYVFTFGQSLLDVFGAVTPGRDLRETLSIGSIYAAQYVTLQFLAFFHMGALASVRRVGRPVGPLLLTQAQERALGNQIRGLRAVGWLFVAISFVPFAVECVRMYVVVSVLGYGGLYEGEIHIGLSNIVQILSQYFIPGLLCLLVASRNRGRRVIIALLSLYVLFLMYIGARSGGVVLAVVLLVYYHTCVRPFRFRQFALLAIGGYFFVAALGVIAHTRDEANADFMDAYLDRKSENPFLEAVSEMGGSMFPLAETMRLVPRRSDYRLGTTYLYSLTSVIPNVGFWDLHPAMRYGDLGGWLQRTLDLGYGPGYSIVAEAYINFGRAGFLFMFCFGFVLARLFHIDAVRLGNPLLVLLSLLLCFLILKTVRNSFLATVRSLFYYLLPIYLIVVYRFGGKPIRPLP